MYVTSTDFRKNIGKYLDVCSGEEIYIMKHGEVYAKLSGLAGGRADSLRRIQGSFVSKGELTEGGITEDGELRI